MPNSRGDGIWYDDKQVWNTTEPTACQPSAFGYSHAMSGKTAQFHADPKQ
jgi:hypothetical protein